MGAAEWELSSLQPPAAWHCSAAPSSPEEKAPPPVLVSDILSPVTGPQELSAGDRWSPGRVKQVGFVDAFVAH